MVKITLSLWDTGGQQRFDFFKSDFFRGCAAVGIVFDLARPDTFNKVDDYFNEIRKLSGNIPIFLVGNKTDLQKTVGETISRDKIIEKVNQHQLFEYMETSALENENVDLLFNRLSIAALMEFKPRLGEFVNENHFRFKVVLAGAAAVGKSSLIKTFTNKQFELDYKITVGLDFMMRDFDIPDDELPEEVHEIIKEAIAKVRNGRALATPDNVIEEEKIQIQDETLKEVPAKVLEDSVDPKYVMDTNKRNIPEKVLNNNIVYASLILIMAVLGVTIFIHVFFGI